ncbi:FdtA/QdtA family cupin domain-containing protein [Pseudomonas sp. F1_0610]|uniref:sugar 3,4-ketoisomerase n=1 Tax=Pseudomonas sp. F1_0610 TaxID=3114284 RepID=UPI0039C0CADF
MSLIQLLDLPELGDERGSLVAIEELKTIPFQIKRVYYIYGTQEKVARGFHAHKKLQQLAICVAGKCKMILDDGTQREEVWLDSPNKAVLIGNLWHEMHDFSQDCVLLVLASEPYDEADYIRDYQEFLRVVKL